MKYLVSLTMLLLSISSQAAFIDVGDYTTDDVTGLNWLDLNFTSNSTLEDALLANDGYVAASLAQVQTLFTHAFTGIDGAIYNNLLFDDPSEGFTESLLFMSLFSVTSIPNASYGLVGNSLELFTVATESDQLQVVTNALIGLADEANPNVGWWLVQNEPTQRAPGRSVPEPASIAIYVAGLVGLGIRRRRKQASCATGDI